MRRLSKPIRPDATVERSPLGEQRPQWRAVQRGVGRARRALRPAVLLIAVALVVTQTAPAPIAQAAQSIELPRLGDAGGDELSPTAERRIGEAIMRDIRRAGEWLDDPEATDYLDRLVTRLAAGPNALGQSFETFMVQDRSINAFALPGGFIGVHTGLIASAQGESELASVLGHEIAHVTQRHIARMLSMQRQSSTLAVASMIAAILAARANPQAAGGIAALGGTVQAQQMLSFSRDAEREADRAGLDMLQRAGFDAQGMVDFFGRLQVASRLSESALPAYLRTHPLSGERMADIQNRVMNLRYRQHADSLEFTLLRARMRALADPSVDGYARNRSLFERQLEDRAIDTLAGHFAVASATLAQRDFPAARRAIDTLREIRPASHPFIERLAAQLELESGAPGRAIASVDQAVARFGPSRALVKLKLQALANGSDWAGVVSTARTALDSWRADPTLWETLARAEAARGQTARAHQAMAEHHAVNGGWPAAIEQLQLAQRAGGLDFYESSRVDARLRELRQIHLREIEERRAGR